MAWGDCMSLSVLTEFPSHEKKMIKFANKLSKKDLYGLDIYWLFLYQLYFKGKIKKPYNESTFDVLKKHNVVFIDI
jgi:hypothetical protein